MLLERERWAALELLLLVVLLLVVGVGVLLLVLLLMWRWRHAVSLGRRPTKLLALLHLRRHALRRQLELWLRRWRVSLL